MATPTLATYINNAMDETVAQLLGTTYGAISPTVTAHSGGGQASAVLLTEFVNVLSTVAALGDSVKLPPAVLGVNPVILINQGAFPAQVFGSGTDTINSIVTTTGISIGCGSFSTFYCVAAGNWLVMQSDLYGVTPVALTTNGAINPHAQQNYIITKAGVLADTLAAPTATTDDGNMIQIISNTANAHTVTATALFASGGAGSPYTTATFAAKLGAGLVLQAYQGIWNVLASPGVTLT